MPQLGGEPRVTDCESDSVAIKPAEEVSAVHQILAHIVHLVSLSTIGFSQTIDLCLLDNRSLSLERLLFMIQ